MVGKKVTWLLDHALVTLTYAPSADMKPVNGCYTGDRLLSLCDNDGVNCKEYTFPLEDRSVHVSEVRL